MFCRAWPQIVLAATLASLGFAGCARISETDASTRTASLTAAVKRGSFHQVLRLNGIVGAVESFSVIAPRLSGQTTGSGTMIVTKIVGNGAAVRKGDILVAFDPQAQLKNIMDRQAEYDGLLQQIRKKKADQDSAGIADETGLKGAEVDVQSALVEMRKNDLVPRNQSEINKSNLAEAEAELKQLKETFDLKRKAEVADLKVLEIQLDRAARALEYAKGNVDRMAVRSTMDGIAVLNPVTRANRRMDPKEGDEMRPGAVVMQVVNPAAMKVSAPVNQVDVAQLHMGQSAEIRLDAYPDMVFPGKVERISAICTTNSDSKQIRFFSATISIQGKNPKLLPDLTAAVDIHLTNLRDVLTLPRQAIVENAGQTSVEIVANGRTERRQIQIGPVNEFEAVVESGVPEGMRVSLQPHERAK
jgi:HlyD family secretion protein